MSSLWATGLMTGSTWRSICCVMLCEVLDLSELLSSTHWAPAWVSSAGCRREHTTEMVFMGWREEQVHLRARLSWFMAVCPLSGKDSSVFALQDLRQPRCPSQVWVCPLAPEPTLFTESEIPRVVKGLFFRAVQLL